MSVTKDYLANQVQSLEQEFTNASATFENAKANLFRIDGALAMVRHMLADNQDDGELNNSIDAEVIESA